MGRIRIDGGRRDELNKNLRCLLSAYTATFNRRTTSNPGGRGSRGSPIAAHRRREAQGALLNWRRRRSALYGWKSTTPHDPVLDAIRGHHSNAVYDVADPPTPRQAAEHEDRQEEDCVTQAAEVAHVRVYRPRRCVDLRDGLGSGDGCWPTSRSCCPVALAEAIEPCAESLSSRVPDGEECPELWVGSEADVEGSGTLAELADVEPARLVFEWAHEPVDVAVTRFHR